MRCYDGGKMKQPRLRAWRLARAARRAERQTAPPPPAPDLPAIAAKADDLEEIKKSVEDAASVSGGLWLSYLFVLSYIAIAAGAVTHEDLLLERPVKLPFLNVELPLLAFFALAPFVVLIIHAYALMHFIMLGKKASRFHNELRRQFPDGETETQKSGAAPDGAQKDIRDKLRRLLPSNIFVQILAGPPELRTGVFGSMLKLIALTTLVVFPILLLLLLQIQFLPFHDVRITWAQRGALFSRHCALVAAAAADPCGFERRKFRARARSCPGSLRKLRPRPRRARASQPSGSPSWSRPFPANRQDVPLARPTLPRLDRMAANRTGPFGVVPALGNMLDAAAGN